MPAGIINNRLITKCEVCGGRASFGHGVSLIAAMEAKAYGNIHAEKKNLGQWYCGPEKACKAKQEKNNEQKNNDKA